MRKLALWGHNLDDYLEIFDLSSIDLKASFLEYGSGASAFNSMVNEKGGKVISCDPLFIYDNKEIKAEALLIFDEMVERVKSIKDKFDFSKFGGLDGLISLRRKGMDKFFSDYETGKKEGRYISTAENNTLPFPDFTFDYALSSHYLFANFDNQDVNFHLNIIRELLRVAKEVRIFPVIDRFGEPSPFLGPVLLGLNQEQYGVEVREVKYSLQAKGNAMLRVWAEKCNL